MIFQRIETPGIAHYAYLIGDDGVAVLVDPRRDVGEYLHVARRHGVHIRYVLETHRQEDFVMGSTHLAERTGAKVVNGKHELFGRGDIRLDDGETLDVGSLRLKALHTPGHTPESMSYAIFVEGGSSSPWAVLTGDALFFGDTGRTDLTDTAKSAEHAAQLWDAIHEKIAPLGDGALVLPAHGAGSVCGSGMASLPLSTIGAEREYNDVFCLGRDEFARKKGAGRLPRPPYFELMESVNLEGGRPPRRRRGEVTLVRPDDFAEGSSNRLLVDTREPEGFAGGHIGGAYSIWLGGLPVFGGWIASDDTPIGLVCDRDDDVVSAFLHLSRIGIDGVECALAGGFSSWRRSGRPIATSGVITPNELSAQRGRFQILDVRDEDEHAEGHIPEARHVYVGDLERRVSELDFDPKRPVVVTCSVGHRASLGASILKRAGYADVRNLLGGMTAWRALDLPIRHEP